MPKERTKRSVSAEGLILLTSVICVLVLAAIALDAQNSPPTIASQTNAAGLSEAKTAFNTACASCHGLDARGGERGPDLVSRPEVVRKTDAELLKILIDGKTAAGMPSFASFAPARLSGLVSYLRSLQGRSKRLPLPGDPVRGKALFFGKAKCAECHMIGGQGGFFGQDLTSYATRMSVDDIRSVVVSPNKDLDPRRGLVTVMLADSTTLSGLPRNEDNFSLQLQTPDGVFHLLNKSDIKDLTYTGRSAMPSDYGAILSPVELNDLVSYLLDTSRPVSGQKAQNNGEEDEE
jgi:putative heme-binding domain-containing protein